MVSIIPEMIVLVGYQLALETRLFADPSLLFRPERKEGGGLEKLSFSGGRSILPPSFLSSLPAFM